MRFVESTELNESWHSPKYDGYQGYSMSANRSIYIPRLRSKREMFITTFGYISIRSGSWQYIPVQRQYRKCTFYYYFWYRISCQICNNPGNHTIFGFCHDSLNLVNSVKYICCVGERKGNRIQCILPCDRSSIIVHLSFFEMWKVGLRKGYQNKTRMHSSRMRTTRSLTISRSIQWGSAHPPDADPPGCRPPPLWTEGQIHVKT